LAHELVLKLMQLRLHVHRQIAPNRDDEPQQEMLQ
jgi:hypothetical protein